MTIKGIGRISKKEATQILTDEGREAVKDGLISTEELGTMYKLEMVRKSSKTGKYGETLNANYNHVPDCIKDDLSPEQIAAVVDALYDAYSAGKN